MNMPRFDWRWIAGIAVLAILASSRQLPWWFTAATLAIAGAYIVYLGWLEWNGNAGTVNGRRVTYWRGQRYEVAPEPRRMSTPRLRDIGSGALYFIVGGAMVLGALSIILRVFRL
jgi:hypothetical protein